MTPNPHIFVINLKHRTDRKKQFQRVWRTAGLPTNRLHWHIATLGTAISNSNLATYRFAAKTRKAKAGRAGCHCSHTAAIRKAIKHNQFPLLVLEDDAIPVGTPDLSQLFASAPPTADLLYFGALPVRNRKRIQNYCQTSGWKQPNPTDKLYGGHAYGIPTKEAAQTLLAFLESHKITFDSVLVQWTKENPSRVAVYCPFQFIQSEGYSDIEGTVRPVR